jgi:hypothetical protein
MLGTYYVVRVNAKEDKNFRHEVKGFFKARRVAKTKTRIYGTKYVVVRKRG